MCSGIAAYFGLDPIILRIIFVILFFIPAGSGLLIYIILWIIIPEAKTTAQKLEMKGEKVNVGNIEKSIKDEFEGVKQNWEKIKKEKKYRGVGHAIERIFYFRSRFPYWFTGSSSIDFLGKLGASTQTQNISVVIMKIKLKIDMVTTAASNTGSYKGSGFK